MTTITDPHSRYDTRCFDVAYGEGPGATRDADGSFDDSAAVVTEHMTTYIDAFQADAVLRIDAYHQRQVCGDDTREHIRRKDNEHSEHLQPCRLLYVCVIEDSARHHAGNCNDAHRAYEG